MTQGGAEVLKSGEESMMMSKLDELVFGMKKFVTFRSVSSKLKIPSASASNVLERFGEEERAEVEYDVRAER